MSNIVATNISFFVPDGKPSGKILNLGSYNNDYEWPEEEASSGAGASGLGDDPKHPSQFYANGTECDLTGNMRKTEVKVILWAPPNAYQS